MTKEWKSFLIAGCIVIVVWAASFVFIYQYFDKWEKRGQFGDLFGSVNALFSGLAFAGLIITIRQQHKDLEYQRQAIDQSKKDINQQNETMKIERFENTFFGTATWR